MFKKIPLILFIAAVSSFSYAADSYATEEQSQLHLKEAGKLWSESKYDLAEDEFKKALEENPESPKAAAQYAGFLLTQNKTEAAIDAYKKAIMLDAENPKTFAALSIAYLHQSKYEMAKAMADEALRLDPKMGAVKKINEYIAAKEEMIEQASKVPAVVDGAVKPNDATHGSCAMGMHDNATGHGATTSPHGELKEKTTVIEGHKSEPSVKAEAADK